MLTTLAHILFNTGEPDEAWLRAEEAVTRAEKLGVPGLLSQALGVRAMLSFLRGDGFDESNLLRPSQWRTKNPSLRLCSNPVWCTR